MPVIPKPPAKPSPKPAPRGAADIGAGPITGLRVSLMPVEGGGQQSERRYAYILAAIIAVETIVFGGSWAYLNSVVSARRETRDRNADKVRVISQMIESSKTLLAQNDDFVRRVDVLNGRLDAHYDWIAFFDFIESHTRPNVTYISFAGDSVSAAVTMDASGRSLRDIAEQIVLLKTSPLVTDVRVTSASTRIGADGTINGVGFTLLVKLKPEAWKPLAAK
ncbi:MAG: hypothetical protein AAB692_00070 [Patescibacteria group bacterium]